MPGVTETTMQTHEYKAGDEVVVTGGLCDPEAGRVLRVTPSGIVVLERGMRFSKYGRQLNGSAWRSRHIVPMTDQWRRTLALDAVAAKLQHETFTLHEMFRRVRQKAVGRYPDECNEMLQHIAKFKAVLEQVSKSE